jgi:hypothetical protein
MQVFDEPFRHDDHIAEEIPHGGLVGAEGVGGGGAVGLFDAAA